MGPERGETEMGGKQLRPVELAEAAVLADMAVGLHLLGWVIPFGVGAVLYGASVVPLAALAVRHRPRAVVIASLAGSGVAFLVGGPGLAIQMAVTGLLGYGVGTAAKKGWGRLRTTGMALIVAGVPLAALGVGLLALFASLRRLTLAQVEIGWRGAARVLGWLQLNALVDWGNRAVAWAVSHWWLTIPLGILAASAGAAALAATFAIPSLRRLAALTGHSLVPVPPPPEQGGVPARLEQVTYLYPGAPRAALSDVTLEVPRASLVAIVGPNGSGKSTLARVIAGVPPTEGRVLRDPPPGCPSRTAMIFQRPESQVLGVRVADDVLWGLGDRADLDIGGLLARVGMSGMEARETSTLSGGQLQRLAIASALARDPSLLVSDESTSMLDVEGREEVARVLRGLPRDSDVTVVHITHRLDESAGADLVVVMADGRASVSPGGVVSVDGRSAKAFGARASVARTRQVVESDERANARGDTSTGEPVVRLEGVGLVYSPGSPWEHRALEGVDLEVRPGEGVLVSGENGSGKTTLAWVIAGLLAPTEGFATLEGRPVRSCVGQVGMAFQHARLQLFRTTVAGDIAFGTGLDDAGVAAALEEVGLDPAAMARRRIDSLSGGEQRRVALAGLVASKARVIVLDEPLAGLDEEASLALVEVLRALRTDHGVATVTVSHDMDMAKWLGERHVVLEQGRLLRDSSTALTGAVLG